jgi:transposase
MDAKAEKIALFRYGLVAPLVLEPLPRGELLRRAREIAARQYEIPGSKRISLCAATLLKWAQRYRHGGFEALVRKPRQDRGQPRSITPQLAELIERLKRENPHRAGTTLLRELALSSGSDSSPIAPATLYRFLQQRGLTTQQLLAVPGRKKFEAELFLFQGIAERAERAALIVTTNLPFSEWTQVFPNPRLCKALLDRITDRAHIIETGTESYRFRRTLEVRQKKKAS